MDLVRINRNISPIVTIVHPIYRLEQINFHFKIYALFCCIRSIERFVHNEEQTTRETYWFPIKHRKHRMDLYNFRLKRFTNNIKGAKTLEMSWMEVNHTAMSIHEFHPWLSMYNNALSSTQHKNTVHLSYRFNRIFVDSHANA